MKKHWHLILGFTAYLKGYSLNWKDQIYKGYKPLQFLVKWRWCVTWMAWPGESRYDHAIARESIKKNLYLSWPTLISRVVFCVQGWICTVKDSPNMVKETSWISMVSYIVYIVEHVKIRGCSFDLVIITKHLTRIIYKNNVKKWKFTPY